MIGIYKITNLVNEKVYIGQSTNIKKRFTKHRNIAFNSNYSEYDYPLYRAIRKYGIENFSFEVIEECSKKELNEKEIYYIAKYDSWKNGYNQDEGGYSGSHNLKLTRDDVSAIILRLKTTMDNTKTIANDFNVGPTTIHYINTGEIYHRGTEQYPIRPHLNKLTDAEVGGYKEREHKYKCVMCGANISRGGTYCVECYHPPRKCENRPEPLELAKMIKAFGFEGTGRHFNVSGKSISKWCKDYRIPYHKDDLIKWYNKQVGIIEPMQTKKPLKKPVRQIDLETGTIINIFESAVSAARSLGYNLGNHISEVCRGELKSAYGFYWEYI